MNSSEKLPFFSNPDKTNNTSQRKRKPDKREVTSPTAKEKKEKKEKKLFFTYITEDCQWGGRPVPAFTMAVSPEEAHHNIQVRYNKRKGNKPDIPVKMEPIKLYSKMSFKEKEDAKKDKSLNTLHSIGQLPGGREIFSTSEKHKKYYILNPDQNTIQKLNKEQWDEIQPNFQKNKENQEGAGE